MSIDELKPRLQNHIDLVEEQNPRDKYSAVQCYNAAQGAIRDINSFQATTQEQKAAKEEVLIHLESMAKKAELARVAMFANTEPSYAVGNIMSRIVNSLDRFVNKVS